MKTSIDPGIIKGSSPFHPGWKRDLNSYTSQVRLVFEDKYSSHLINLTYIFWNTDEPLYGLPHLKVNDNELIVPAAALELIDEKCLTFEKFPVVHGR